MKDSFSLALHIHKFKSLVSNEIHQFTPSCSNSKKGTHLLTVFLYGKDVLGVYLTFVTLFTSVILFLSSQFTLHLVFFRKYCCHKSVSGKE